MHEESVEAMVACSRSGTMGRGSPSHASLHPANGYVSFPSWLKMNSFPASFSCMSPEETSKRCLNSFARDWRTSMFTTDATLN